MSSYLERLKYGARSWRRRTSRAESWIEWIYPYRALWLTRQGWIFVGVTFAIGFAALNTGHNLFYLVFAMLVSMVAVSGVLSERTVKSLRLERILPAEIHAGTPAAIALRVRNAHPRRSSYGIEVRDGLDREIRRRAGSIVRLEPGQERTLHTVWTFPKRGRVDFGNSQVVTRFPFGLFEKIRILPNDESLVVFPALDRTVGARDGRGAERGDPERSRLGDEMASLRPFRQEDDPRWIHWRVSARVGEVIVQEPGEPRDQPVSVFLETRTRPGDEFERAVSRAATLLVNAVEAGSQATLYTPERVFPCADRAGLRRALGRLAEITADPEAPGGEGVERWAREGVSGIVLPERVRAA